MPDVAVVGAGAFGSWIALRLRQSGRSVVLVEAFAPAHPKASSGAASRVIRMGYGAAEIYTRWSQRSLILWKDLFARVGRRELFQPTGVLWTARVGHPYGTATLATLRAYGVPHETLTASEIQQRYPAFRFTEEIVGIFEPESGALLAAQAVAAVTDEAQRRGVERIAALVVPPGESAPVDALRTEDGRRIAAGTYVFACGPWLPKLFPRAIGKRIRVTRQPLFYFDAGAIHMPTWIDFTDPRGGYAMPPLAGKGFKLGLDQHGPAFDPDSGARTPAEDETAAVSAFLAERFPTLCEAPLIESEVCQYESTSSGDFLLDRHPAMPNVWLAGGGSGHGFKHGPAVGEYIVARLDGAEGDARFAWENKRQTAARAVY